MLIHNLLGNGAAQSALATLYPLAVSTLNPKPFDDGAAWSAQAGLVRSERPLQWQRPGLALQKLHPDGASHASAQQGHQSARDLPECCHACS